MLAKKGVYPYSYTDNMACFHEISLTKGESFSDFLKDRPTSKKQHQHADELWVGLGCTTMLDYHNHYLRSDILLLANVFETFREMILKT